jgi:soluble P-type ATPase
MTKEQILGNYYREHKDTESAIYEAMDHYKDQEVAKEREKAKKLVELLHEIDKSLYIGDDLNDIDILKWYLDVICTIKDEIKQSLTEYGV